MSAHSHKCADLSDTCLTTGDVLCSLFTTELLSLIVCVMSAGRLVPGGVCFCWCGEHSLAEIGKVSTLLIQAVAILLSPQVYIYDLA